MKKLARFCFMIFACAATSTFGADVVLRAGRIVTVDAGFDVVQAMAISDGRVTAVGSDSEIASLIGPETKVIDLQGKMVLPGLIDSHVHPTGASRYEADHEIPPLETIEDVLSYLRGRAEVVPAGEWIVLQQVFITRLREQRFPTREEMDSVAPRHPVWFGTGPDGSSNSLGLAENGIDEVFAAQHPDQVGVDPATGKLTGVIRNATSIFKTRSDKSREKLSDEQMDDRLVDLLADYNRWGIPGVIDRACSDASRAQYARLLAADRLTTRVRMSRSMTPNANLAAVEERLDAIVADPFFKSPDPRLAVIGVKVFEDGGVQFVDTDRLEELVRLCAARNLAFTAHCQGDAAVEALLEAYDRVNEDIPIAPTRSSVTHSSFMSERAIEVAARLGVGVDLQPAWLYLDA